MARKIQLAKSAGIPGLNEGSKGMSLESLTGLLTIVQQFAVRACSIHSDTQKTAVILLLMLQLAFTLAASAQKPAERSEIFTGCIWA